MDLKKYTDKVDSDDESIHSNSIYDEVSSWDTNIINKKNHVQFKTGNNWGQMAIGFSNIDTSNSNKKPMLTISKKKEEKIIDDVMIDISKKTTWCDIAK